MRQREGRHDGQGLSQRAAHVGSRLPTTSLPDQYRGEQQGQQKQNVIIANQDVVDPLINKTLEGWPEGGEFCVELLAALLVAKGGGKLGAILVQTQKAMMIRVALKQELVIDFQLLGRGAALALQVQGRIGAIHMINGLQTGQG